MIDYVYGGEFMNVTSSKGMAPYISHTTNPMTGAVSYDSSNQQMKVFDGNGWQTVGGGTAMVNLNPNAIAILKWAEKKMQEEVELKALAQSNSTIKDLLEQIEVAKDQIKMVQTLIKKEEKVV